MTRREEINQQAEEYRQPYRDGGYRLSSKDVRDAFEEGAEWADKTMIEKAKAWVKNCFIGPLGEGLANNISNEFAKYLEE